MTEQEYLYLAKDDVIILDKKVSYRIEFKVVISCPFYVIVDSFKHPVTKLFSKAMVLDYCELKKKPEPEFTQETFLANHGKIVWVWTGLSTNAQRRRLIGYNPKHDYKYLVVDESNGTTVHQHISLTDPNN